MPDSQTAVLPPDAVNAANVLRRVLLRQWALLLSMPLLLWPALYNGFPLVFSDTGTYISQLIERHLGWDRPPFYSLFLLLLGWGKSLWPPVTVQAIFTAWLITRVRRTIIPQMGAAYDFGIICILAIATALPWATGEIMPDLFTPLMVLGLFLLAFDPNLQKAENALLILTLAGMMTFHLTNLPIYLGLCLTVLALAWWIGMMMPWRLIMAAPVLSILALSTVNFIGTGTPSISPYGATFYLARLLADGPARETLAQDCPHEGWALCHYQKEIPDSADAFLWMNSSPLYQAGGPKRLIVQTKKIIRLTLAEHPASAFDDATRDMMRQLLRFKTGDGLRPWRHTAGATIQRDLPPSTAVEFRNSLQARGRLRIPGWLQMLNRIMEIIGVIGSILMLCALFVWRRLRHSPLPWLACMTLLTLLGNAAVTGILSGPHDRYQSRIMWLPDFVSLIGLSYAFAERPSRPARITR